MQQINRETITGATCTTSSGNSPIVYVQIVINVHMITKGFSGVIVSYNFVPDLS